MELLAGNFLGAIAGVLNAVLSLYFWIVIASAVLSWVNPDPYNPIVRIIRNLTEPVFYKVRKLLPFTYVGGLDLSPVVILLGIEFIKMFVIRSLYQFAGHM
ncbi:YggT family protein [Desulfovibrio mangrovi]|uniref:YggT family protein n=1 Tax=Desulfovibrio mangrovi TaxID=2976983 RepID=UPI0022480488|nr:YggT family protein [Desulfovibrio mangrovi]UZP68152.1 YggT family protein [Desulfovibrio mangrovi]